MTPSVIIEAVVSRVPVVIPWPVVSVIMIVIVIMVAVIVVPVMRAPTNPVPGIVSPIPWRVPYTIGGKINVMNYRPGSYFVIGGGDHFYIAAISLVIAFVTRVGGTFIDGLDNVVFTI